MPESIEIPAIASGTAELSEGLKVLIGAGKVSDEIVSY